MGNKLHWRVVSTLLLCTAWFDGAIAEEPQQPNFLVIVADDMGWSDIGVLGGEIRTPNIDFMAESGVLHNNFYVAPTCAPTRSMLLTGTNNHEAGVGTQQHQAVANQLDNYRYAGELHNGVVTVAEALSSKGYETLTVGKWHLAVDDKQMPHNRGFKHSYSLQEGGASHFGDALPINPLEPPHYFENGVPIEIPADFYSTIDYTDKTIEYIKRASGKPFFAYVAYTAPHDPLQVPDDWIDRYDGAYASGSDVARNARLARQIEKGIFAPDTQMTEIFRFPRILPMWKPLWADRTDEARRLDAKPMEIYASMVELMDQQIGRILAHLRETGQLENTYVLFFSDNGASLAPATAYPGVTREWLHAERDMDREHAGRPRTHTTLDVEWAALANTPMRLYKASTAEGGIRSPLVVMGPGVSEQGFVSGLAHVMDIAPTLYELAGIDVSTDPLFADKVKPRGQSLVSQWQGGDADPARALVTELFGNRAVRKGPWKAVYLVPPFGTGDWELFNLEEDPGSILDLADDNPKILKNLVAAYDAYAIENGVIAPDPPIHRDISLAFSGKCDWMCEARFGLVKLALDPFSRWAILIGSLLGAGLLVRQIIRKYGSK